MLRPGLSAALAATVLLAAGTALAQEREESRERGRSEAAQQLREVEGRRDEEARKLGAQGQEQGEKAREKAKAWDDPERERTKAEKKATKKLREGEAKVEERPDVPGRDDLVVPPEVRERGKEPPGRKGPDPRR